MKKTLISIYGSQTTIATILNNELVDLNIDSSDIQQQKTNIYMAQVSRIEPSLNAIFVDYGDTKDAFLPLKEISKDSTLANIEVSESTIKDCFKIGQNIIIQIAKDKRGLKGAYATTFITLAGVYIVFLPNSDKPHGISKCINEQDRVRIKSIIEKLCTKGQIIIRTACVNATENLIIKDFKNLLEIWQNIKIESTKIKQPGLIYKENSISARIMRDYISDDIKSIVVDDKNIFDELKNMISITRPLLLKNIHLFHSDSEHLFEHYGIQKDMQKIFDREITLSSGGSIVIENTEALVSIDVNSFRSTKHANIENTSFSTNKEALLEIAKQIKFRNIGGLIVIDLIDMSSMENKSLLEEIFIKELSKDSARIQMTRISQLGLIELSRQQVYSPIRDLVMKKCQACQGMGRILPDAMFTISVLEKIKTYLKHSPQPSITVNLSSQISKIIFEHHLKDILIIEKIYKTKIMFFSDMHHNVNYVAINQGDFAFVQESNKKTYNISTSHITKPNNIANIIPKAHVPPIEDKDDKKQKNIFIRMWNFLFPVKKQPILNKIVDTIELKPKLTHSRLKTHIGSHVIQIPKEDVLTIQTPSISSSYEVKKEKKVLRKKTKTVKNDNVDLTTQEKSQVAKKISNVAKAIKPILENTKPLQDKLEVLPIKEVFIDIKADNAILDTTNNVLDNIEVKEDLTVRNKTTVLNASDNAFKYRGQNKDFNSSLKTEEFIQIETNASLIKQIEANRLSTNKHKSIELVEDNTHEDKSQYSGLIYSPAIETDFQGRI